MEEFSVTVHIRAEGSAVQSASSIQAPEGLDVGEVQNAVSQALIAECIKREVILEASHLLNQNPDMKEKDVKGLVKQATHGIFAKALHALLEGPSEVVSSAISTIRGPNGD